MTKYYLKMDNIMKNMFVVALNDELQAQSEQDECLEETKALLKKVSEYDLAQKRLQITAGEQRQIRKALNRELACAALDQHTGTYSRQKVSAQAYCAAYVIAKRYGVDVTGFNLEYIAQRNECGKKDPQELRDFLNDVRQASYSIRNHIERNFGAKEQEYITDEFAIGDPVKIPETKDEKPSEKASGKEKKAKSQPER